MKEIKVTGVVQYQELKLEDIKDTIQNKSFDNVEALETMNSIIQVKKQLEDAEAEFKAFVKEQLENFNAYKAQVDDIVENDIKQKAIEYAKETMFTREYKKVNEETGEVTIKHDLKHGLPKGFSFTPVSIKHEYDEAQITDDKFYKKTLKKTEVKKAVACGELPKSVIIEVEKPESISITPAMFSEHIKLLESYKESEDEN